MARARRRPVHPKPEEPEQDNITAETIKRTLVRRAETGDPVALHALLIIQQLAVGRAIEELARDALIAGASEDEILAAIEDEVVPTTIKRLKALGTRPITTDAEKWRAEQHQRRKARQARRQQQQAEAHEITQRIDRMQQRDPLITRRRAIQLYLQNHDPTWKTLSLPEQKRRIATLERRLQRAASPRHDG